MHRLLVVLLFGSALSARAQNNTPEPKNNSELNNKSFNVITNTNGGLVAPGNGVTLDTVRLETPETIETTGKKPYGAKEKKAIAPNKTRLEEMSRDEESDKLEKAESVDTPAATQTMQMQQQFQINQSSSSRQYSRRSASDYEQTNMDNSVRYYKTVLPDAFETHFFAWLAGRYNTGLYPELQAAAELRPGDTEVKKQLAAYHIINGDSAQAVPIIRELIDTGAVSSGQLLYANDLLVSCEPNSVVVLHGFDDMFATYFVQNSSAVRRDVQLLSLDFMQSATYRASQAHKNMQLPETEVVDTAYLAELCRLNQERTMQLSMTIPKDYFVGLRPKLYPAGLTFRYSEVPLDLYDHNYSLWAGAMNLQLIERPMNDKSDQWSANYLPMLVTLRRQLELMGRKKEVEQLDRQILAIGSRTNNTERVKKYTKD
jgi:hypothetical protein